MDVYDECTNLFGFNLEAQMSEQELKQQSEILDQAGNGRRLFLRRSALLGAGVTAGLLTACAGNTMAASNDMSNDGNMAADVKLLNTALGLEQQAIAAYQIGAESGLLKPSVKSVALEFQSQHKQHAAALSKLIKENNGMPVSEKASLSGSMGDLASAYNIPAGQLHSQADVVKYAAGLEEQAAKAYLSTIPQFKNRDLAHAAASIEGDETMHWAVLRNALGMNPVPVAFI